MKHYICLDGDTIYYTYGEVSASGFEIKETAIIQLPDDGKEETLKQFVKKYKLNNKIVTLSLGSGLLFREFKLPKANSSQLRKMVKNELTYAQGYEKEMAICYLPYEDRLLSYAIPKIELQKKLDLLSNAGIHYDKVLVLSNCISNMIAKLYPDKKIVLVVEINDNQLRLQFIQNGYCLLTRNIRLNVKHFCETQVYDLLYDEVSDQVSKVLAFHASINKKDAINEVILVSNFINDLAPMAEYINKILKISCSPIQMNINYHGNHMRKDVLNCYCALATMCQSKRNKSNLDFFIEEKRERREHKKAFIWSKKIIILSSLLLSIFVLSGVWFYYYSMNKYNFEILNNINTYMNNPEILKEANRSYAIEKETLQLQSYIKILELEQKEIQTHKWLNISDYNNLIDDFLDGMSLEEMHYNDLVLEVVYLAKESSDIADLYDRVKARNSYSILEYKGWTIDTDFNGELRYKNSLLISR